MSKRRIDRIMSAIRNSDTLEENNNNIITDSNKIDCRNAEESSPLRVDDNDMEEFEEMFQVMNQYLEKDIVCQDSPDTQDDISSYTLTTSAIVHEHFQGAKNSSNDLGTSNMAPDKTDDVVCDPNLNMVAPQSLASHHETYSPAFSKASDKNSPLPLLFTELDCGDMTVADHIDTPMPSPGHDFDEINASMQGTENSPLCCDGFTDSPCSSIKLSPNPTRKRAVTKKSNPGKKRIQNKHMWKDVLRKNRLNKGQAYTTRKGKEIGERTLRPPCNCKLKCFSKFSEDERRLIHTKFWDIGDHTRQWEFIARVVQKKPKQRSTKSEPSNRNFTLHYFLPKEPYNSDVKVKVCREMFLNTLTIGKDVVYTATEKRQNAEGFVLDDKRGKHENRKLVVTTEMRKSICDHVNLFTPVESHYCRNRSQRKYLDGDLSFRKMFQLYIEWCNTNGTPESDRAKSIRQYRDVVNKEMNIGFYIPKKDQCDDCHQFKNIVSPTQEQKTKHEKHLQSKDLARKLKNKDKSDSCNNPEIITATFDFQKVLSCPYGEISIFYYKRKLSLYNFTVYVMSTHEGLCFMWHEATARRGANEVASCLFKFIEYYSKKGVKEFRLWSDNCAGQNRNRIVYSMYLYASVKFDVKITHRFLEKGHTQNEGDSVHALIEKCARGREIYSPDEWFSLIRFCKATQPFYKVIEVNQDDILDFKALLPQNDWKTDTAGEKISWNSIKEIYVDPKDADFLYFKYDLSETEYMSLRCINKIKTRRNSKCNVILKKAYNKFLPIPILKYKDLQELCKRNSIPGKYVNFYESLPHTKLTCNNDDPDDSNNDD